MASLVAWSVCPLMPSCNTYCLTWVSLTLDVGYHFTASPAKHGCCSLPWMRGISSWPPLLTLNVVLRLHSCCSLDVGLLLLAAAPDFRHGVSNSVKPSHAVWGHPRQTGHGGEVWQNVVHWRRAWQTTSVFLPWEPHEQYAKAKW